MKDLAFCDDWGEKLAARHPDDLSLLDQTALWQHLAECPQCATAYAAFKAMEARMQALPKAGPLPRLLPKLQTFEQNRVSDADLPQSALVGNSQAETPSTAPHIGGRAGAGSNILQIAVQCYDRFFEVLSDEVENVELIVEDAVSQVLLDLFDEVMVDDVTIHFSSGKYRGLQHCSIQILAQCSYQSSLLLPRTKENIELAVEQGMSSILKELFGSVMVDSVVSIRYDSSIASESFYRGGRPAGA